MTWPARIIMKNLYERIYNFDNLYFAYKKTRAGKTRRAYVLEFEKDLEMSLLNLQFELKNQFYSPLPLKTFILRDPKTRKISKSHFRDRVVHHALVNVIEQMFEKSFIHDSCANRVGKGTLFAIKRFNTFLRKVSKNNTSPCFIFKADIKHYFQEVDHEILLAILRRKITDEKVVWLIYQILRNKANFKQQRERESNLRQGRERHASRQFDVPILRECLSKQTR